MENMAATVLRLQEEFKVGKVLSLPKCCEGTGSREVVGVDR
jgi:hypothetical protein